MFTVPVKFPGVVGANSTPRLQAAPATREVESVQVVGPFRSKMLVVRPVVVIFSAVKFNGWLPMFSTVIVCCALLSPVPVLVKLNACDAWFIFTTRLFP